MVTIDTSSVTRLARSTGESTLKHRQSFSQLEKHFCAGHTEAVEALLVASADPNIHNSKSWSAVQSAAANGHFEAVLRLVQHGASWRNKADCDVIKTLTRKSTLK